MDFSVVNKACLSVFGQAFTLVPTEGQPRSITGIIDTGVQPEGYPPADGSTYARLWSAVTTDLPAKGDTIESDTTAYRIFDIQRDAGGGVWFLLRKDHDLG